MVINKITKALLFTIGLVVFLYLVTFTMTADRPWWGLVKNPAFEDKIGASYYSVQDESGNITNKLLDFYEEHKRWPQSFRELDSGQIKQTGTIAADKSAIIDQTGYDTTHYVVKYKDGSQCDFKLMKHGFKQICTRRDYWIGGSLTTMEPIIINDIAP